MAINMSLAADLLTSSARQRKSERETGRQGEKEREESATVSDQSAEQSAEFPSGRTLPQHHNSTHSAGQAGLGCVERGGEWVGRGSTGDNMALPDNTCSQLLT